MISLSLEEIKKFLPHRDPFLFVDRVTNVYFEDGREFVESKEDLKGVVIEAEYSTKSEHPIFAGHFPGNPILPGVVQVEMIAQVSSFCSFIIKDFDLNSRLKVALVKVSQAKFRKPITPGMDLTIKSQCLRLRGSMMSCRGELYHEGQLMAEAEVMASIEI